MEVLLSIDDSIWPLLALTELNPSREFEISEFAEFFGSYTSCLTCLKTHLDSRFFKCHLEIYPVLLTFVLRRGKLNVEIYSKEFPMGDAAKITRDSIEQFQSAMSGFPYKDYAIPEEDVELSWNQLMD